MGRLAELAHEAERAFASNVPPSVWGPKAWALLHATVEELPCPTCRREGVVMMEGMHDVVNVYKGDRPERPRSLCTLVAQVAAAAEKGRACPVDPQGVRHARARAPPAWK